MSEIMLAFLYALCATTTLLLVFLACKAGKNFYKSKKVEPITEETIKDLEKIETVEETASETTEPVVEEVAEETEIIEETAKPIVEETEIIEETAEPVVEETEAVEETEVVEETAETNTVADNVVAYSATKVVEETEEETEEIENEEIVIADIDETDDMADKLNIQRVHFAQKLIKLDEEAIYYYDEIYNKFNSFRNINARLSFKHVTFRYKRKLIAKLTVKGKTLKLHLALDTNAFNNKIYFQTDLSGVKAYEEVPFTVKVKSGRALKRAINLIDILCEKEGVEPKVRCKKINSIHEVMQVLGVDSIK